MSSLSIWGKCQLMYLLDIDGAASFQKRVCRQPGLHQSVRCYIMHAYASIGTQSLAYCPINLFLPLGAVTSGPSCILQLMQHKPRQQCSVKARHSPTIRADQYIERVLHSSLISSICITDIGSACAQHNQASLRIKLSLDAPRSVGLSSADRCIIG